MHFALYVGMQVIFLKNLVMFQMAFTFVYIGFVLLLPIRISPVANLMIGFFTGLMVDMFYDTLGINAAACTLLAYLRLHWLNFIKPQGGYENINIPSVRNFGLRWFSYYTLPLIFIFIFTFFFIEHGGIKMFSSALLKSIASTFLTYFLITLIQYLFYPRQKDSNE
ncbi:hypothetical protein AUTU_09120 [Aureibacter tunicatorum]|nr:hypothetical protein AUTU_09120 [Aureibacter tunicatorum]